MFSCDGVFVRPYIWIPERIRRQYIESASVITDLDLYERKVRAVLASSPPPPFRESCGQDVEILIASYGGVPCRVASPSSRLFIYLSQYLVYTAYGAPSHRVFVRCC